MGTEYWVIKGVGINTERIREYLDKVALANFCYHHLLNDDELYELIRHENYDDFDIEEYLHGQPFDNLADLLTYCDDTDTLTYGEDKEGNSYLYYPPSMPWELRKEDPRTLSDAHDIIADAILKVTSELSRGTLIEMIDDDLNELGDS